LFSLLGLWISITMEPIKLTRKPIPYSTLSSPADTTPLRGKSILITGGARGFGSAFVRSIAAAGAVVTIADINESAGTALAEELTAAGHKVGFTLCDVREWRSNVSAFKAAVMLGSGKLDHVVLNAGVMDTPFFTGASRGARDVDDEADGLLDEPDSRVIDVCCKGMMYGLKLAQVYLGMEGASGDKSIMILSSPESYISLPGAVNYVGAKFGARGLWRASREMFAYKGIRSNSLVPWLMDTDMNAGTSLQQVLHSQGIHFTPVETHVGVGLHLLADKSISGRAIALGEPGGSIVDLEEDELGFDGTKKYWELLHKDLPGLRGTFANLYALLGFQVDPSQLSLY